MIIEEFLNIVKDRRRFLFPDGCYEKVWSSNCSHKVYARGSRPGNMHFVKESPMAWHKNTYPASLKRLSPSGTVPCQDPRKE